MIRTTRLTVMSIALFAFLAAFAAPLYAQHDHTLSANKMGMARFSKKVRVGDVVLPAGMYHVQHVVEGSDHVIVFKPVTMPAGFKEYQMVEGREVVRLKCTVSPVDKSVSNTKIKLGRNAAGEQVIEEIQIAGEKVKHTFLTVGP
jgi:hypothetical protein